jgi:hypothetical protein
MRNHVTKVAQCNPAKNRDRKGAASTCPTRPNLLVFSLQKLHMWWFLTAHFFKAFLQTCTLRLNIEFMGGPSPQIELFIS